MRELIFFCFLEIFPFPVNTSRETINAVVAVARRQNGAQVPNFPFYTAADVKDGEVRIDTETRFLRLQSPPTRMMQGGMGGHHVHVQGWIQQHFQHHLLCRYRVLRRFLHDQLILRSHVGTVLVNRRYPKPAGTSQEERRSPCRVLVGHSSSFRGLVLVVSAGKRDFLVFAVHCRRDTLCGY